MQAVSISSLPVAIGTSTRFGKGAAEPMACTAWRPNRGVCEEAERPVARIVQGLSRDTPPRRIQTDIEGHKECIVRPFVDEWTKGGVFERVFECRVLRRQLALVERPNRRVNLSVCVCAFVLTQTAWKSSSSSLAPGSSASP